MKTVWLKLLLVVLVLAVIVSAAITFWGKAQAVQELRGVQVQLQHTNADVLYYEERTQFLEKENAKFQKEIETLRKEIEAQVKNVGPVSEDEARQKFYEGLYQFCFDYARQSKGLPPAAAAEVCNKIARSAQEQSVYEKHRAPGFTADAVPTPPPPPPQTPKSEA